MGKEWKVMENEMRTKKEKRKKGGRWIKIRREKK